MYTIHGRGADLPIFLLFGHGPILVQINLQHSQAQPLRHIHLRYFPNSNSLKCGASHREAVSTIFKVFGMTRSSVD